MSEYHPQFEKMLEKLYSLHRKKSYEYGLENLYRLGPSYMVARIVDKAGRLEGFLKGRLNLRNLKDELQDIAVCAILALCLLEEGQPAYIFKEYEEDEE